MAYADTDTHVMPADMERSHPGYRSWKIYKAWRTATGLTDAQLHELTGAHPRTLRSYRLGQVAIPDYFLLACAALETNDAIREFVSGRKDMFKAEKKRAAEMPSWYRRA